MDFRKLPLKQRILALAVVLTCLVLLTWLTPMITGGPCQALERAREACIRAGATDFSAPVGKPEDIFTTEGAPAATSYEAIKAFAAACKSGDKTTVEKLMNGQKLFQVQPGNDVILVGQQGEFIHIRPIEGGMDIYTGTWALRR